MITPLHRDARLDGLDAEQFERMLASNSWQLYTARLHAMMEQLVQRCVVEKDVINLRLAQGGAETLRSVLAVPQTIRDEIKRAASKKAQ